MKKRTIVTHPNAVVCKSHNRRAVILPTKDGENVIIEFTILDGDTNPRSVNTLSHRGKAVVTGVKISRQSAEMLLIALQEVMVNFDKYVSNNGLEE